MAQATEAPKVPTSPAWCAARLRHSPTHIVAPPNHPSAIRFKVRHRSQNASRSLAPIPARSIRDLLNLERNYRPALGRQFPNGPVVDAAAAAVDTEDRVPVDKLAVARF